MEYTWCDEVFCPPDVYFCKRHIQVTCVSLFLIHLVIHVFTSHNISFLFILLVVRFYIDYGICFLVLTYLCKFIYLFLLLARPKVLKHMHRTNAWTSSCTTVPHHASPFATVTNYRTFCIYWLSSPYQMLLRGKNKCHGEGIKMPHLAPDEVGWKPRVDLNILWQRVGLN